MKKIFRITFALAVMAASVSCYDDTYLRGKVQQHEQSIIDLETLVGLMDGTVPKLKMEQGHLWVSYDEGRNWEDLGAAGTDSEGRGCTIGSVEKHDGFIRLVLSDGTVFEIPLREGGVRSYYEDEIAKTKASVYALTNEPCLVFPLLTDIHYLAVTSDVPELIDYTTENILALQKDIAFDFLACMGDVCRGDETLAKTESAIKHVWKQFRRTGLPIYACVGNHDDNRYEDDKTQLLDNNMLYSLMIRDAGEVMFDMSSMNGTNFYRDFPNLNIRCIFLNSNENYAIAFSDATLTWFEKAMDTDLDTYVFAHSSPVNFSRAEGATPPKNGDEMVSIMKNSDNFKMFFHGHNHFDCEFTAPFNDTDNPILAFSQTCNKCYMKTLAATVPMKAVYPERTPGTVTEDCFDIVVIRPKSGKVNLVRFGAGIDREFNVNTGWAGGESVLSTFPQTIEFEVDFTAGNPFNQPFASAADQVADGEAYTYTYTYDVDGTPHAAEMEFKVRMGCDSAAKDYYELTSDGLCFKDVSGTQTNNDFGAIRLPAIGGFYLNTLEAYCTSEKESTTKRVYLTTRYQPGIRVDTGVADCAVSPNDKNAYRIVYELPVINAVHTPYAYSKDGNTKIAVESSGNLNAVMGEAYTLRMRQSGLRVEKLALKYTKTEPVAQIK